MADAARPELAQAAAGRAAEQLFAGIRGSAIVASGLATWAQASPGAGGTIGASLYAGTAGMGWSLGEYAAASGTGWAADLARCAIAHALRHAPEIPAAQRMGFHGGWTGIAFAAARVAQLLEDAALRRQAGELLAGLAAPSAEFDLVSGAAGAVLVAGLLEPAFGDAAAAPGLSAAEQLRQAARVTARDGRRLAAWAPPRRRGALPLTGLAHGAAGPAWALLELWRRRPERVELRELACQAFAYEDSVFDEAEQNWPDLRHYASWRAARSLPPPCQVAWCHGAGGEALARLRAYEITGDPAFAATALRAGATLLGALRRPAAEAPAGLCHGRPGNADILLTLGQRLEGADGAAEIAAVAREAAMRAAGPGLRDPGLMLGAAGEALFLLRAAGLASASGLMPPPWEEGA